MVTEDEVGNVSKRLTFSIETTRAEMDRANDFNDVRLREKRKHAAVFEKTHVREDVLSL